MTPLRLEKGNLRLLFYKA